MVIGQVKLNLQEDFLTSNLPFKDTSKRSSKVVAVNQLRLTSFTAILLLLMLKKILTTCLKNTNTKIAICMSPNAHTQTLSFSN